MSDKMADDGESEVPRDTILIHGKPAPWNSVPELVRGKALQHGDKIFATIDGRDISYRDLDTLSDRVAANLARIGIGPGACVASLLSNCAEQAFGWIGTSKTGAIWAPFNASLTGDDLVHTLRNSGARMLITDAEGAARVAQLPAAIRSDLRLCLIDAHHDDSFTSLLQAGDAPPRVRNRPGDPAMILYTGGTTGLPKGVVLPHFAIVSAGYRYGETLSATSADRHYTSLPLFHASGVQLGIVGPLLNDMTVVMDRRFSASGYWQRVREVGATIIDPISTMMSVLVQQPASPLDRQHRVRITTGVNAQIPPSVPEEFTRRFGIPIVDIYGQSETGGAMATSNRPGSQMPGSVGKPNGWSQLAILDENDCQLPPGVQGNIALRPTIPFTFMLGYQNDPEATRKAWRNLWFHSGDLGHLDEHGNLFFTGRQSHWLRRRGENISAYEIEAVLTRHAAVREAIVTGFPSELGEDDVKAWIVPEGDTPSEIELIRWCLASLAAFKVPRYIAFVDDFPRSATKREVERTKVKAWPAEGHWDRDAALGRLSPEALAKAVGLNLGRTGNDV
jgi:crotonobetaine/carnitine-CoA ligase